MKPSSTQIAASHPVCPLCNRPLADEPTTTVVDNGPYLLRNEPPVSVPVHRTCARRYVATLTTEASG